MKNFAHSLIATSSALIVFNTLVSADDHKTAEPKIDLKVDDLAPTFQLKDDAGKTWSLSDHVGKKWVVVYFYPGDFTPGCTAQAKAFNESMAKLTERGVEVVGISGDSVEMHAKFKKDQKLGFTLLADPTGEAAKKFGVPVGKGATVKARDTDKNPVEFERAVTLARWTFVIGLDGKVAYKNEKVIPAQDAKKIAEFIEAVGKK
jgi:peroxiredoxin Q/BCP